ncbi:hypothetical protein OG413_46780 [Streptomyces sp. NBC_01433]|uniref:hypothetical protein n=1 Tax=Streptomyces sp. NBC_01433 TaxID=2903864 RepID=UPI00225779E7|nr:hypothetical protein [Streptomyces sp. NBC_01433]MCX4682654.1 hypothetical protein [Streptomyces sp. NBC_01433]MCX4682694.1 hypothetical protein [Streptomyces sp. NBC_01433]
MIFGFSENADGTSSMAPLPDALKDQVESTIALSNGATYTDAKGDTYTTSPNGQGD